MWVHEIQTKKLPFSFAINQTFLSFLLELTFGAFSTA